MTHPEQRTNLTSQQPDDDTRPMFAVPEEQVPSNGATTPAQDPDEITDQLDSVSGGIFDRPSLPV